MTDDTGLTVNLPFDPTSLDSTEPPPPEVFCARDVSFYYGGFRAITGVTLDIYEHQTTAFIGPSGCGKTTFLRCLNQMNDLIPNTRVEGQITYRSEDLYDRSVSPIEVRRRIGMVFQRPNPFPKSIYDNVAFGPRINGSVADRTAFFTMEVSDSNRFGVLVEIDRTATMFTEPKDKRTEDYVAGRFG
jgi:phosphate transport system ATP-binding protein